VKKAISGGSGGAVGLEAVLPHPGTSRPTGWTRFLENERLLAFILLTPTVVLLGLFIARNGFGKPVFSKVGADAK
jgi:hypothetical protein